MIPILLFDSNSVLNIGKFEFRICFGFRYSDFGFIITKHNAINGKSFSNLTPIDRIYHQLIICRPVRFPV